MKIKGKAKNKLVRLDECPCGLFSTQDGYLCMKTEYSDEHGPLVYLVSSGEALGSRQPDRLVYPIKAKIIVEV